MLIIKLGAFLEFKHTFTVIDAFAHDSQPLETLLKASDEGQVLSADSAYDGPEQETIITNCLLT